MCPAPVCASPAPRPGDLRPPHGGGGWRSTMVSLSAWALPLVGPVPEHYAVEKLLFDFRKRPGGPGGLAPQSDPSGQRHRQPSQSHSDCTGHSRARDACAAAVRVESQLTVSGLARGESRPVSHVDPLDVPAQR
eukprot:2891597-Prymnesium_polylepis.4